MLGFDPKFEDFPGYLLGVSQEIWEERGLAARMQDYLHPEVILRSPQGVTAGEGAVTAAALSALVECPDTRMLGEDVIWCGSAEAGFAGAQRQMVLATHLGDGMLGAATGRRLRYRVLSEITAKANRISEIWQVRDTGAVLRQLGQDPRARAAARVAEEASAFQPEQDVPGPYTGGGNDNQWGQAFADLLERIMAGELSVIAEQYDRACQMAYPGGVEAHGHGAAERFWLGLRAAFPSARFEVHHRIGMEGGMLAPRAALRWSLQGRHAGWGAFGKPSGAMVHVMGISQAEFGPGGLRREWTLFDEEAVWMQVAQGAG